MSKRKERMVLSAAPADSERPIDGTRSLELLGVLELLFKHLTPALCRKVYARTRLTERERKWTFEAIVSFWMAMIVRQPSSLTQGVVQTRRRGADREAMWPEVRAEVNAFFEKCAALRADFFKNLYLSFTESLLADAPESYASWLRPLRERFPNIIVVDGSVLDAVQHKLKLLWAVRETVLPGQLSVFYDLFRGVTRHVAFCPDAHTSEFKRFEEEIDWIPAGSLVMGDRLYGVPRIFETLASRGLQGLFRRNRTPNLKVVRMLDCRRAGRDFLDDALVAFGGGRYGRPAITVRRIRWRSRGRSLDLVTSVLDPAVLSAEQAVALYGQRWSIERMFLDLKKTLKLHGIYGSHPNLVAQQLYATAIVYNAFRVAQARLSIQGEVLPEQLSPEKLFPVLARSSSDWAVSQLTMTGVRQANPGVRLSEPDWRRMGFAWIRLADIIAKHRRGRIKPPRRPGNGGRWKSFAQLAGGKKLLRHVSN